MRKLVGTLWRVVGAASILLMTGGTIIDSAGVRSWAVLVGMLAGSLWLKSERMDAAEERRLAEQRYLDYMKKWAHQPYESGWHAHEAAMRVRR